MKLCAVQRSGVLVLLIAGACIANGWESALFPLVDGRYCEQTVNYSGRDWRLDDYSYAGYELGNLPAGTLPVTNQYRITASGDIAASLRGGVQWVAQRGGGRVIIPAGTFTVGSTVAVDVPNVVIEGAGSGQTILQVPASYHPVDDRYEGLFTFGVQPGGWNEGWFTEGAVVGYVTNPIARGAARLNAFITQPLATGDWIVVQQYFWTNFVNRNSAVPGRWKADGSQRDFSFSYLRRVTARSGAAMTLDAPLPWTLAPTNNPVILRRTNGKLVNNVGLRGVTIKFAANANAADGRPAGVGVYFEGVLNGWAEDVVVTNFPRYGFFVLGSARMTLQQCSAWTAQDEGSDYGYAFYIHSSQNVLVRQCRAVRARHNFIIQQALASLVVFSRCVSEDASEADETHHSFSHGVLWDQHTQRRGGSLFGLNRGDYSEGAYETLGSGTVWNFNGDGVEGRLGLGAEVDIRPAPEGDALVVGFTGNHALYDSTCGNPFENGPVVNADAGLQTGGNTSLKNVLYEGVRRAGLQPESLYEAQRLNRVGDPAVHFTSISNQGDRIWLRWTGVPGGWSATIQGVTRQTGFMNMSAPQTYPANMAVITNAWPVGILRLLAAPAP